VGPLVRTLRAFRLFHSDLCRPRIEEAAIEIDAAFAAPISTMKENEKMKLLLNEQRNRMLKNGSFNAMLRSQGSKEHD
jgi:hypothetical protein